MKCVRAFVCQLWFSCVSPLRWLRLLGRQALHGRIVEYAFVFVNVFWHILSGGGGGTGVRRHKEKGGGSLAEPPPLGCLWLRGYCW